MVTEYFVCSASSPQKLQDTVKAAIANGWQPFGGVEDEESLMAAGETAGPSTALPRISCGDPWR
jgi:hypothetical protein